MKKCPHCAEADLQDDAKICKHCGKELDGESAAPGCALVFAIIFLIAGLFFWPLLIVGVLLLILRATLKK